MDWGEWRKKYGRRLKDDKGGFEVLFINSVLTRTKGLNPSTVKRQTRIEDHAGGPRYIDFTIEEGPVRIFLEVDGWDKRGRNEGMNREEFEDWSFRELSITAKGWTPMRFANSLVRKRPETCREFLEIRLEMERKQAALIEAGSELGKELERTRSDLEAAARRAKDGERASKEKFYELQESQTAAEAELLSEADRQKFEALQVEVDSMSKQLEEERGLRKEAEKENRGMKVLGIVFGVAIVVIGVIAVVAISGGGDEGGAPKTLQQVQCEEAVSAAEVGLSDVGSIVNVSGEVVEVADRGGDVPLLLNMDEPYPDQVLAIKIWRDKLENWGVDPDDKYLGRTVAIKGELEDYEDAGPGISPLEIEANAVNDIAICS
jgi:very-short-patch-repair endonuclease